MINLKRITTSNEKLYAYAEHLLTTSFPLEEYRPLNQWKICTDKQPLFYNNVILSDQTPIGIITFWKFSNFYYVEHFAIDEKLRNQGYGQRVLRILEKDYTKPIILEVEMPTNATAQRRIKFYQNFHFVAWEKEYVQPPYRPNETALPMIIMCRGNLSSHQDFDAVRTKLYQVVYNIFDD